MDEETVSAIAAHGDVTQVLLTWTSKGWQASVGKGMTKGYSVGINADPNLAMFEALNRAGVVSGPGWRNPNPFRRLENAIDRLLIEIGNYEP